MEIKTGLDADALATAADDDGAESEEDPGYFEQGYYDDDSAEAGEDGQQPAKSPEPEALVETVDLLSSPAVETSAKQPTKKGRAKQAQTKQRKIVVE